MSMTMELPPPLERALRAAAEKAGAAPEAYAAALLSVGAALLVPAEAAGFGAALRELLSRQALDAARVADVLEQVVTRVSALPIGQREQPYLAGASDMEKKEQVEAWLAAFQAGEPVRYPTGPRAGERTAVAERRSARGMFAHLPGTSDDYARLKQAEIDLEDRHGR
jgi:hypothetical protein